jgi:hypothetical protein
VFSGYFNKKYFVLKTIKNIFHYFSTNLIALAIVVGILSFSWIPIVNRLQLKVDKSSVLYLKGTSNINSFQCTCTESFPTYNIGFKTVKDGRRILFTDAQIKIPTKKLDCQNRAINKDLFKALRADDFRYITIDILEAYQMDPCFLFESCDEWTNISVGASMKIAGVCQAINLDAQATKLAEDRYRILADYNLSMYDFNIDPPSALMGLIKVDHSITIYIDLTVEVLSPVE